MRARIIESICKRTVAVVLLIGILLLSQKGILPIGIITLFFLSGSIISLLFRSIGLILKLAFVWLIIQSFV